MKMEELSFDWYRFSVTLGAFMGLTVISILPIWPAIKVCPNFLSGIIYHWLIYRRDLVSIRLFFVSGLFRDALFSYPLGVCVCELSLMFLITLFLRRRILGQSFAVSYIGYGIYCIFSYGILWVLLSLDQSDWLSLTGALPSLLFNMMAYPAICRVSFYLQRVLDKNVGALQH